MAVDGIGGRRDRGCGLRHPQHRCGSLRKGRTWSGPRGMSGRVRGMCLLETVPRSCRAKPPRKTWMPRYRTAWLRMSLRPRSTEGWTSRTRPMSRPRMGSCRASTGDLTLTAGAERMPTAGAPQIARGRAAGTTAAGGAAAVARTGARVCRGAAPASRPAVTASATGRRRATRVRWTAGVMCRRKYAKRGRASRVVRSVGTTARAAAPLPPVNAGGAGAGRSVRPASASTMPATARSAGTTAAEEAAVPARRG